MSPSRANILRCVNRYGTLTEMNLITTAELARRWRVTKQRIQQWCAAGRIQPAMRLANGILLWPADLRRPRPLPPGRKRRKSNRP